jgi:hypothetical protein
MAIKNLIFIFSLFFFQIFCQNVKEQLRWTFELINHGARSPHKGLDSDFKDFSNHTWIGQNELTGVGLRQSFLIGYRDRLRYLEEKQLISKEYDPREMLVYASENNRTLMSANALLHGLYPPGTGPTIDPSLVDRAVPPVDSKSYQEEKDRLDNCSYTALPDRMNLIPVHINFAHEFFTQYETSKKCEGLKTYEEKNKKREKVVNFLKEMNIKYKNLEKIFHDNKNTLLEDYEFAYTFFDTMLCLYYDAAEEFDKILTILEMTGREQEVIKDCEDFLFLNTVGNGIDNDKEFINYLVSPLFQKLIILMDLVIEKDSNGEIDYRGYDLPKYYIISAVANTCGSFMAFMNKYFNTSIKFADFATNIHLELYLEEKENGTISESDYRLEYYFNDDFLLSIPYTEFKNKIKNELYDKNQITEFCKKKDDEENNDDETNWYIIGTIVGGSIIVVLVIIIIIILKKRMKNKDNNEFDNGEDNPLVRDTRISGE